MKTTIDTPEQELREVMKHDGASTKREAVVTAIVDFNRRRRLAKCGGALRHFRALPQS